jgi:hypothetical protein
MANLLRIVLALAEDPDARHALRSDPAAVVGEIDDLCAEDVAAAIDVARVQVSPELAEHLTGAISIRATADVEPRAAATAALLALCEAVEGAAQRATGSHEVPTRPPGPGRPAHLWALDGGADATSAPVRAGGHPAGDSRRGVPLAPVPDPPGGFEFSPLELVLLPSGLPDEGIEPGALATVVAVHREPELHYEIEVSADDGGRRFLGTVPPSSLDRYTG